MSLVAALLERLGLKKRTVPGDYVRLSDGRVRIFTHSRQWRICADLKEAALLIDAADTK